MCYAACMDLLRVGGLFPDCKPWGYQGATGLQPVLIWLQVQAPSSANGFGNHLSVEKLVTSGDRIFDDTAANGGTHGAI